MSEPIATILDLAEPQLLEKGDFLAVVKEGNLTDLDAALAAARYLSL